MVELVVSTTTATPHCPSWGEEAQTVMGKPLLPDGIIIVTYSVDCIRLFHETREKGKDGGSRYDADRGCSEPGTDGAQSARPQLDGRHLALPKWKWSLA